MLWLISPTALNSDHGEVSMRDAVGPARLKWALEWPVTTPRSPFINDDPPASIPNVKIEFIVLGSVIALGLVLVTFHSALGF
jgi:hypothetical protein